jgi:hypothetical protein
MKKIAIFFCEDRDILTYPYIVNTAKILIENNFQVDLYLNSTQAPSQLIDGLNIILVSKEFKKYEYIKKSFEIVKNNNYRYDFIISYSVEGLIIHLLINSFVKSNIFGAYFSMELVYKNYINKIKNKFKRMLKTKNIYFLLLRLKENLINLFFLLNHKKLNKLIKFSVIMDDIRANLLKEEFDFVKEITILPNSYIGFDSKKSNFAHKKFNIPDHKKILIYVGAIEKWAFDNDLPQILNLLNDDYVLLINGFSRDNLVCKIKEIYKNLIEENRLIINLENFNDDEYTELIKSCYLGLVWYNKINKKISSARLENVYYIGWSSGKLCKYLSCGLPVIAPNYFYNFENMINNNGIGKTCLQVKEIPSLINEIEVGYENYIKTVNNFYCEKIEFKKQFIPILNKIMEITNSAYGKT